MSYNLDDKAPESFEFTLGGNKYLMRYPTTEEITLGQDFKDDQKKQAEWLYGFITPVEESAPAISEALAKVNVKVLQRFNKMILSEFGAEE